MKCKACKNTVPDGSIYCNFCGEKLVKTKREKESGISVPKARQKKSGLWVVDIMVKNERRSFSGKTAEKAQAEAMAWKEGLLDKQKAAPSSPTLREAIDQYIEKRSAVLSPVTIRGYRTIQRNRFKTQMDKPLLPLADWQSVVNAEAKLTGAKTLKNSWLFCQSVIREAGINVPSVTLPMVPKPDRPWLDHVQIPVFLRAVHGDPCELVALLGLHGLRRSEIFGLKKSDIDLRRGVICVRGSVVPDENNNLVRKETAKNRTSQRVVPIMIPALRDLLSETARGNGGDALVTGHPNVPYRQINRVCREAGLPEVGLHGLRHSFASLAHHLGLSERETMEIGGWADQTIMHEKYTHLSAIGRAEAESKLTEFFSVTDKITDK